MQEIRSSNNPVVIGICVIHKSRARHYHSYMWYHIYKKSNFSVKKGKFPRNEKSLLFWPRLVSIGGNELFSKII